MRIYTCKSRIIFLPVFRQWLYECYSGWFGQYNYSNRPYRCYKQVSMENFSQEKHCCPVSVLLYRSQYIYRHGYRLDFHQVCFLNSEKAGGKRKNRKGSDRQGVPLKARQSLPLFILYFGLSRLDLSLDYRHVWGFSG